MLRAPIKGAIRTQVFSIAKYSGRTPFDLQLSADTEGPVLRAADVTDMRAEFVADPFLYRTPDCWYLFFEVLPVARAYGHQDGVIAVATSRDAGRTWKYERVVLREPFHLSYPYLFDWQGEIYMVPESHQGGAVRLYRAREFPWSWTFVTDLIRGDFTDASPFYFEGSWWMLAEAVPLGSRWKGQRANPVLRLYYADELEGPWREHPASPVVESDTRLIRPAGRVVETEDGRLFRFAQDGTEHYGAAVHAVEITKLTRDAYLEREAKEGPILAGEGHGWNADGMHHIDLQLVGSEWIAFVDGWSYHSS